MAEIITLERAKDAQYRFSPPKSAFSGMAISRLFLSPKTGSAADMGVDRFDGSPLGDNQEVPFASRSDSRLPRMSWFRVRPTITESNSGIFLVARI